MGMVSMAASVCWGFWLWGFGLSVMHPMAVMPMLMLHLGYCDLRHEG
jgi:energy-converting hydrogenase Eha subunit G